MRAPNHGEILIYSEACVVLERRVGGITGCESAINRYRHVYPGTRRHQIRRRYARALE